MCFTDSISLESNNFTHLFIMPLFASIDYTGTMCSFRIVMVWNGNVCERLWKVENKREVGAIWGRGEDDN